MIKKRNNVKDLLISFFVYSSASVFGPLLVIGGIGLIIYRVYDTNIIVLIFAVFLAFICTNVLLFKKLKKVNYIIDKHKIREIREQEKIIEGKVENKEIKDIKGKSKKEDSKGKDINK